MTIVYQVYGHRDFSVIHYRTDRNRVIHKDNRIFVTVFHQILHDRLLGGLNETIMCQA